jgi:hypothetical protein
VKKIAVYAHDAGGSEIVLEFVKNSISDASFFIYCLKDSPCEMASKQKNLEIHFIEDDKDLIFEILEELDPDAIFYSTGWQNHIEYIFLQYAKTHDIPSVAFLDNWTNYRERFSYPDTTWKDNLPSFIAVHGDESEQIAKSLNLPNIIGVKNYSLLNELKKFEMVDAKEEDIILFLSEPTAKVAKTSFDDENYWGFSEEDVFKEILLRKELFKCSKVVVRLHPADVKDTYLKIKPDAEVSDKTLQEDIARAKVIIGIDTVALYIAYLLGKKTVAFMPSQKRAFHVPLPKENQIRDLKTLDIDKLIVNKDVVEDYGITMKELLINLGV